ncbi:hypothetical protein [Streptomyces sp. Ru87]|uniref:hypothetical protein n=1 Tax=Streptomyces sp. Ru87 TaxID=2044307 RepID=UPI000BF7CEB5|nr:hypothetical protein [Streptomyces sp. Ru87]PGH51287.1 hypothetical protein CRI70_07515 [Streptomyces sp. Ru87]
MHIWQPEPDETLLARTPVTFATGAAMRVKGMRWFRDTGRRDIQGELPGWPEGRDYTAHSSGNAAGRTFLKGGLMAGATIVWGVLSSQGGSVGGGSGPDRGSDRSDDPEDEVHDFPVMWAAPGTLARTLPWQLDPGRTDAKRYTTHAVVTDRRLLVVGLPVHKDRNLIYDEVLWETPRSTIASVERRDFKDGVDAKVIFTDGSWCRLRAQWRIKFTWYLTGDAQLVPFDVLTPSQQQTARTFAATQPPDAAPPIVSRNSCGCYRVHVVRPNAVDSFFGLSEHDTVMDAQGTELDGQQYHPEDFTS